MISEHEIKINFQLAKQQAARLDEIADNMTGISNNEFGDTLQQISVNWKGDNSVLYLKKGNRLQDDMTSTAKSLKAIASEIRSIAERIYRTEMKNLEIARRRDH